jgi:hypothetical protein
MKATETNSENERIKQEEPHSIKIEAKVEES